MGENVPIQAGSAARPGEPQAVELTALDLEEVLVEDGWDAEEARSTLLQAASHAAGAPTRIKDVVSAPREAPVLRMPAPPEVGPPGQTTPGQASASSPPPGLAPRTSLAPRRSGTPPPLPPAAQGAPKGPGVTAPLVAVAVAPPRSPLVEVIELVEARVARLARSTQPEDKLSLARAHLELAALDEANGDGSKVLGHAEAALRVEPTLTTAHTMLRRARHARTMARHLLDPLEREIAAASEGAQRADLLAEKARLLEALDEKRERLGEVRAAWDAVLAVAPNHPAALKGLEAALTAAGSDPDVHERLANHLGRMAEAYGDDPGSAAWLKVEQARILDRKLSQRDAAWGALKSALSLDGSVGPVRAACVRHAARHADFGGLFDLLVNETTVETDAARLARLELDAAALASTALGENERAIALLERARGRAPTTEVVDRYVLDRLLALYEAKGSAKEALDVARARLPLSKEPRVEAYQRRLIAAALEEAGDDAEALAEVERALALDAGDPTLLEAMDRLLVKSGNEARRAELWAEVAARTTDASKRCRLLLRASKIAEAIGRPAEAIGHLRAALAASPADGEVVEALARLLTPTPTGHVADDVRARIAIYAHAAEGTEEPSRRIGYLEKVALLWEESLGEPELAARAYKDVLALDPERRTALVGLQRTAARAGDAAALARALLDEAKLEDDDRRKLDLQARAAAALAVTDADRALLLVQEILKREPAHEEGRALEARLHEVAGRWDLAAKSLSARIDTSKDAEVKVHLLLARAEIERVRLGQDKDALASLRAVRLLDPKHPVPPDAVPRLLEATGDFRALRDALVDLAGDAATPIERVCHLARAAELDEFVLRDDGAAAALYVRALEQAPSEALSLDRLGRLAARLGPATAKAAGQAPTALAADPSGRLEGGGSQGAFERAMLFVEAGCDPARVVPILESIVAKDITHVPALRTLESIARVAGGLPLLANALAQQADALRSPTARLGALWAMAQLVEWRLPESFDTSSYQRILDFAPMDRNALDAMFRRTLPLARKGDGVARVVASGALMSLLAHAPDDTGRLLVHLELALLHAPLGGDVRPSVPPPAGQGRAGSGIPSAASRSALDHYRTALRLDPLSVVAATGTARFAAELHDGEAGVAASCSLAELASDPQARARHLLDAAELLLAAPDDPRMGTREQRRTRAAELLEKALDADPESIQAAGRLAVVRAEDGRMDRLVETFRGVIRRATSPEAIILVGTEIARIARTDLRDRTVAVDAMRRVREVAPDHVPSLLALGELYIADRAWQEASQVLESVVKQAREPAPKLTALFALANLYERVLLRPEEALRVLRTALDVEPGSSRALRGLLRRAKAKSRDGEPASPEVIALLDRLAQTEPNPEERAKFYVELAEARMSARDRLGAERAWIEAIVWAPTVERLHLLSSFSGDLRAYAASLSQAVKRAEDLGRPSALCLSTLGELEVELLNHVNEGIGHLRAAAALAPGQHETRCELAAALQRAGKNEEAAKTLIGLITPDSRPLASLRSPARALETLERALAADRHSEEALVVREIRAALGLVDDAGQMWLRTRRLTFDAASVDPVDRATLLASVVPPEGRHVLVDVGAAMAGMEGKLFRTSAADLGVTSRDRVSPRSGHPLRSHFERLTWLLRVPEAELYVTDAVGYTKVVAQDVPWIVAPQSLLDQPDARQTASLARALTRVALGVPWLEELPPLHAQALLTAAARHGNARYGSAENDQDLTDLVGDYEPRVARAIGRKQRKHLTDLAPRLDIPRGPSPTEFEAIVRALSRAELRIAFLVTGDLLTALDELRALDEQFGQSITARDAQAVGALFAHPLAGDLVRFALSTEATTLRWRMGTIWGPAALGALGR